MLWHFFYCLGSDCFSYRGIGFKYGFGDDIVGPEIFCYTVKLPAITVLINRNYPI